MKSPNRNKKTERCPTAAQQLGIIVRTARNIVRKDKGRSNVCRRLASADRGEQMFQSSVGFLSKGR